MSQRDLPHLLYVTSYTLCVLLCVTSVVQCSDITFTGSPSAIKPLVTDSLALRCGVKDGAPTGTSGIIGKRDVMHDVISTDYDISSATSFGHTYSDISKRDVKTSDIVIVGSIAIVKNNVDVASITEHVAAKVFNNNGGVHVTGNVTASGAERGFLQVTWDYPDSSLSGSYQCIITGYDVDGHQHMMTETVDVDDNEVTLNDVVRYIHQLKLDNEQQKQSIEQQKLINNQQKQLIEQQTIDITQLQKSNADLTTKVDTKVIFSAYLSKSITVSDGNILVFDKLRSSIGGGYNTTTGIFKSPVSGYYLFELHISGVGDTLTEFALRHNNDIVSWTRTDDGKGFRSDSKSVALLLQKGDTVKLTAYATCYPYGNTYGSSSFSGYLIDLV